MTSSNIAAIGRAVLITAPLIFTLGLTACGGGGDNDDNVGVVTPPPPPPPAPPPPPPPSPTPSPTSRNVSACLNQVIPNTGGRTVASLAVPDALRLDFSLPNGFPNGRQFDDPVVDITLAALLLDLSRHSPLLLAGIPLNPRNDNTGATANFPFLGPTNGVAQPTAGTGTAFSFRTDPPTSFTRVDRMGNPAVGSIIGGSLKDAFNDGNLSDDLAGTYLGGTDGFINQLTIIHDGLFDDLTAAGLTPCST